MDAGVPLRVPLSVGEIASDAIDTLRNHFRAFLVVALPFVAVDLILREAGGSALEAGRAALGVDPSKVAGAELASAVLTSAKGMGLYLCAFVVLQVGGAACVLLSARAWMVPSSNALSGSGHAPALSVGDALAGGLRRAPALVLTAFLFTLIVLVVVLISMLPLIGAAFVDGWLRIALFSATLALAITLIIAVTLRFGLYTQMCVIEKLHTLNAFSRSADLLKSRGEPFAQGPKFRLSTVFLLAFALSFVMQGLFAVPRYLMASSMGWSVADAGLPPLTALPLWFGIPFALVEVAANAMVVPFSSVLLTLFYFDLRVRYEMIDVDTRPAAGPAA